MILKDVDKLVIYSSPRQCGKSWYQQYLSNHIDDASTYAINFMKDKEKETCLKTENLTLVEAIEALEKGLCEGFKRDVLTYDLELLKDIRVTFSVGQIMAKDWKLVNPNLPTETRYFEKWFTIYNDGSHLTHRSIEVAIVPCGSNPGFKSWELLRGRERHPYFRGGLMSKIRMELDDLDLPSETNVWYYNAWICSKLTEAGIPIIGGPLLPRVDTEVGTLKSWKDFLTGNLIFEYEGNPNGS